MKRSWDGCLREVVGKREVPLTGVWLTTPERRRRPYVRRMVAVLECGHTKIGTVAQQVLSPGTWVICSECRDGRKVPETPDENKK